jgi:probable phosphoglycerate mutase
MRLLLIRHGQTPANVLGLLDTRKPGPGLTRLGELQAAAVPDALEDEGVERIFATTLIRTRLTAEPLAERLGLDVTVLDGLREIEAGDIEDHSDPVSVNTYVTTALAWAKGDLDLRMPGGPDGHEFFDRFDTAIAKIAAAGAETTAVFSHGMAIRCWASDGDEEGRWRMTQWHTLPIGGLTLHDAAAVDPTGESVQTAARP